MKSSYMTNFMCTLFTVSQKPTDLIYSTKNLNYSRSLTYPNLDWDYRLQPEMDII